ncbi:FixH family protein [Alkalilimnicola sp. S0819]|uniref:FixH family protein n=1 Tax=Alkalilimnicola sp. S0819 TaxID=2613922 RepID=UPI0012623C78|nr:FixH family protein [Alkalilimnicola sp. S0819]KAB7628197.1 FixH family protein [Alkalilimnicola sp. S0819]MPQ15086.1 hypothetical protein [Alkalilimnicola sp. S0819]
MPGEHAPWYKQFWPWFLIALPGSVVVAGILTLVIAASGHDSLVVDDYGKIGLITEQRQVLDRAAAERGLSARLNIAREQGRIMLILQGAQTQPQSLQLRLTHPTLSNRDLDLELRADEAGVYRGQSEHTLPGRWLVQIQPLGAEWRLAGELADDQQLLQLAPRG